MLKSSTTVYIHVGKHHDSHLASDRMLPPQRLQNLAFHTMQLVVGEGAEACEACSQHGSEARSGGRGWGWSALLLWVVQACPLLTGG